MSAKKQPQKTGKPLSETQRLLNEMRDSKTLLVDSIKITGSMAVEFEKVIASRKTIDEETHNLQIKQKMNALIASVGKKKTVVDFFSQKPVPYNGQETFENNRNLFASVMADVYMGGTDLKICLDRKDETVAVKTYKLLEKFLGHLGTLLPFGFKYVGDDGKGEVEREGYFIKLAAHQ